MLFWHFVIICWNTNKDYLNWIEQTNQSFTLTNDSWTQIGMGAGHHQISFYVWYILINYISIKFGMFIYKIVSISLTMFGIGLLSWLVNITIDGKHIYLFCTANNIGVSLPQTLSQPVYTHLATPTQSKITISDLKNVNPSIFS